MYIILLDFVMLAKKSNKRRENNGRDSTKTSKLLFFCYFFVNLFANVVFFSYLCSDFVCMYLRAYASPMRTKGTKSVLSS